MSNTVIQIKRSTSNSAPLLSPGELAYTSNGDVLFIGSPAGSNTANVFAIAGKRTPGTLTANQAVVVNANGFINESKTNKLIIGSDGETANITAFTTDGTFGTANVSNTTIASTFAIKNYIDTQAGSSTLGGLSDVTIASPANNELLVYDGTAGQWENHNIDGTANEVTVSFSNNNITIGLPDDITVGANLTVTNHLSTNTANITGSLAVGGTSTTGNVNATGTVNATAEVNVGANVNISTTTISVGNSTVNTQISSTGITANGANISSVNAATVGSNTASDLNNFASNAASTAYTNATAFAANASNISSGTLDNSRLPANVSVTNITSTGNTNIQGTLLADGNVVLGNNTSDNISFIGHVNTSILPASNTLFDLGSQNLQWATIHANNAHVDYITVDHDVTVSGNLTVSGSLVTINVSTLAVTDPLIHLATNNNVSDTLDIGFYGNYNSGAQLEFTGLFRDATDGVYKLFKGANTAPTTTIDPQGSGFSLATLSAFLDSGALTTNATAVTITANATVNVAITANTLSLSSPLAVSSGGLGISSLTANSILSSNSTGGVVALTSATEGHVLQIVSGTPTFGMLDGGTF
jgi:hypothetical protein